MIWPAPRISSPRRAVGLGLLLLLSRLSQALWAEMAEGDRQQDTLTAFRQCLHNLAAAKAFRFEMTISLPNEADAGEVLLKCEGAWEPYRYWYVGTLERPLSAAFAYLIQGEEIYGRFGDDGRSSEAQWENPPSVTVADPLLICQSLAQEEKGDTEGPFSLIRPSETPPLGNELLNPSAPFSFRSDATTGQLQQVVLSEGLVQILFSSWGEKRRPPAAFSSLLDFLDLRQRGEDLSYELAEELRDYLEDPGACQTIIAEKLLGRPFAAAAVIGPEGRYICHTDSFTVGNPVGTSILELLREASDRSRLRTVRAKILYRGRSALALLAPIKTIGENAYWVEVVVFAPLKVEGLQ